MNTSYSIGEFSQITGLSAKTLRLYNEKGILIHLVRWMKPPAIGSTPDNLSIKKSLDPKRILNPGKIV